MSESTPAWVSVSISELEACENIFGKIPPIDNEWPAWVKNVAQILIETLFPKVDWSVPVFTPSDLGGVIGQQQAFVDWWESSDAEKEIEQDFKRLTPAQRERMTEPSKIERGEKILRIAAVVIHRRKKATRRILARAHGAPAEERNAFFASYAKGLKNRPSPSFKQSFARPNTALMFTLFQIWPLVVRMPSIAELHRALVAGMGIAAVGSLKTFHRTCDRIDLRLRKRGRPRKPENTTAAK